MKPRLKPGAEIAVKLFEQMVAAGWVKVPPGWSLVPDQPTPEQLLAASSVLKQLKHPVLFIGDDEGMAASYLAMVKAAPTFDQLFASKP